VIDFPAHFLFGTFPLKSCPKSNKARFSGRNKFKYSPNTAEPQALKRRFQLFSLQCCYL
jgi:hypothetical protein